MYFPVITVSQKSVHSVCRHGTDMSYVAIQTEAWKTLLIQVVRLCGYLTFIRECSVTTNTASNHRGNTKLEFVKTAHCSSFFFFFSRRAISTLP